MAWTKTYDEAEPQRVNKWLAQSGVCSRREAEALIGEGLVYIDGERVEDAGRKIQPGQTLTLTDKAEGRLEGFTAILNKPTGYVSGQPEPGYTPRRAPADQGRAGGRQRHDPDAKMSLPPLGRLDLDSHGLLILSERRGPGQGGDRAGVRAGQGICRPGRGPDRRGDLGLAAPRPAAWTAASCARPRWR